MIKNFEIIKDYVYKLGGFEQSEKMDLQIQAVLNDCLAYCYRADVPELMELPLAEAIAYEIQRKNLVGVGGDVKSYSEGDMSITYTTNETTTNKSLYNGKLEPFKLIVGA